MPFLFSYKTKYAQNAIVNELVPARLLRALPVVAAPHDMASRRIYIFKLGTNTHTCLHGHHISTAEDPTTLRSQSGHAPAQKNLCRQKRQWYAYSWKVLPSGFVHSVSLERALLSFRPHVYLLGPSPHLTCMVYTTACSEELRRLNLLFA